MRVAVVTPLYRTPPDWLEQCLASVARQTAPGTHFVVCDGDDPFPAAAHPDVRLLRLPGPHRDFGNAARAAGSVSAVCQGFDAVAYLDADNWYEPDHLERLLETGRRTGAAVCSAARRLVDLDGRPLGPCPEVDGAAFVDTNCLLLARPAFGLIAAWYLMPRHLVEVGDRVVWKAVKDAGLPRAHQPVPTVNYRTRHAAHYEHFGRTPPAGAKRIVVPALPPGLPAPPPANAAPPAAPAPAATSPDPAPAPAPAPAGGTRPRVSLCMIVKNEEANLPACLGPVAGLFDEVVVVDTGSTDRTLELALAAGARVVDFPWADSFAAARNEGLRHATGDWVFWLDADDRLDAENRAKLQALLGRLPDGHVAYMMRQWSEPDALTGSALAVDHPRLFRRLPAVRWRYRIHEQVLPALHASGAKVVWADVVIRHLGYRDPALRRHKLERNLRLLELELREDPRDAFTRFNLAGTLLDAGRVEEALPHLHACLEHAPAGASFLPKAHVLLAQAHRCLGRDDEALRWCTEGRRRFPGEVELWCEEGLLRQARREPAAARDCYERALSLRPRGHLVGVDPGLTGFRTRHNLALALRDLGQAARAEAQWQEAVREAPDFGPAWLGLAELYLDGGRPEAVAGLLARLEGTPHGAAVAPALRARAALAERDFPAARRTLEEAIAAAPASLWLRLLLSEVLLREGKDPAAAERHLRAVLELDPNQKQARQKLDRLLGQRPEPAGRPHSEAG